MTENFKNPFEHLDYDEEQIIDLTDRNSSVVKEESGITEGKEPRGFNPYQNQEQTGHGQQQHQAETEIYELTHEDEIQLEARNDLQSTQNQADEPPLLEDIGIQPHLILQKMVSVITLQQPTRKAIELPDLSGPLLVALCLGVVLLLAGKAHFGDIYAMFIVGNILICLLFNFMSQTIFLSLYSMMSILGYCMLPLLVPALFDIFFSLKNEFGVAASVLVSVWSSYSASNFIDLLFESGEIQGRRILYIYPMFLYYISFSMLVIL